MKIAKYSSKIPKKVYSFIEIKNIEEFRPCQFKAIDAGLFDDKNLLICTPTASGKTLVAEMAALNMILEKNLKAIYIAPLKALASEKHKEFKRQYGNKMDIALSIGDTDAADSYLAKYNIIMTTSEKLDSLIRHHCPWLKKVGCVIIDEIHLLNDPGRGPTLEILISILRTIIPGVQIIGLSATIGNPEELAEWLQAELVVDYWRPTKLFQGILHDEKVEFVEDEDNEDKQQVNNG